MSLEILNLSLEKISKLNPWVWRILQTHFGFWKKTCFRDFVSFESEFGEISKLNPWVWRILQTQPLSVYFLNFVFFFEKNEFGDFEPEFGENLQTQPLSLENSPNSFWFLKKKHVFGILFLLNLSSGKYTNSTLEFGEFSKLKGWVWRFPRTQIQKKQNPENMFFFTNRNEFGEFSKLKSLENSPNSESKVKIRWVWRILQTNHK